MRIVALLVAAGLVGLAGCGDPDDAQPAASPTTVASDPSSTTAAPSTTTSTSSTSTTTTVPPTTSSTTTTTVADTAPVADTTPRACSAEGMDPALEPRPDLPPAVQATRQALVDAAVACDYEALAALATTGTQGFTYSFGEGGDPAGFWRRAEADGGEELRLLVSLLGQPSGQQRTGGTVIHAWPAAFTREFWNEVPVAEQEALRPLFDPEEFEFFEKFGAYLGHRVGIAASGEWVYFVAGD